MTTNQTANDIIDKLGLSPLPGEGGFYRETYRSTETVAVNFSGDDSPPVVRNLNTQIYYMVTPASFSALHKLKQDEIYHFYAGAYAEIFLIFADGSSQIVKLGNNITNNEVSQLVIPAGTWQGVRMTQTQHAGYSLMGTSVSPGFDFADFELGNRSRLVEQYPDLQTLITRYTRAE